MMNLGLRCGAAIAALAWGLPAAAQDGGATADQAGEPVEVRTAAFRKEILVAASRDETVDAEEYTGSATQLSPDDMLERQTRDIADVLRDVPGVAVSGVAGQTQVRLRGTEANHVLVLVDGIEVSDPFAGEFDLGTLQAEPGASLNVLRGPQSALYGADAIGGVIAYQSANGRQLDGLRAYVEGGTDGALNGSARYGLGGAEANLALGVTMVSTDGQPNARGGSRKIGRDSLTLSGKGEVWASDNLQLRAVGRFIRTDGDFNEANFDATSPTFGLVIDSPETRFENEAVYGLAGMRLETFDEIWTHDLSLQFADIARDTFGPFGRSSGSEGDRLKASYVSSAMLGSGNQWHFITVAADWERERFRNNDPFGFAFSERREIENVGLVGEYRFEGQDVDISAAIRHDFNTRFADATTFRISGGVRVADGTRLRGSVGTGIKNPGFFELFGFFDGRFIGNADLRPEKSTSWELGADQTFADEAIKLSVTFFDSELEDEIFTTFPAPDFIATPANRTAVSTQQGIELSANAALGGGFTLNLAYSFLDAEEDGVEEVRRPDHLASAVLNWRDPGENFNVNLAVRHNGEAQDLAFTDPSFIPVRVVLDDFWLVNLNAEMAISQRFSLFGRVENLLDESYEQVFSFVSPGRSAVFGISASF